MTRLPNSHEELIHVRLSKELVKRLDHYAVDEDIFRQTAFERLIKKALDDIGYQYPAKDAK